MQVPRYWKVQIPTVEWRPKLAYMTSSFHKRTFMTYQVLLKIVGLYKSTDVPSQGHLLGNNEGPIRHQRAFIRSHSRSINLWRSFHNVPHKDLPWSHKDLSHSQSTISQRPQVRSQWVAQRIPPNTITSDRQTILTMFLYSDHEMDDKVSQNTMIDHNWSLETHIKAIAAISNRIRK